MPKQVGGMPINTWIVEGIMCTANGFSQLREICSTINMPCMLPSVFNKMIEAVKKEKRLAMMNNEIDDDDIWSYKTNYTQHKCNKNCSGSSTATEADIIAEDLFKSIPMHGLKYSKLLRDVYHQ